MRVDFTRNTKSRLSPDQYSWCRRNSKLFDDGAIRPVIAMTIFRQMLKCSTHCLKSQRLFFQLGDVLERYGLHIGAGAAAVPPQRQEVSHLFDREAEVPGAIDEAKRMDVVVGIDAIPGI